MNFAGNDWQELKALLSKRIEQRRAELESAGRTESQYHSLRGEIVSLRWLLDLDKINKGEIKPKTPLTY